MTEQTGTATCKFPGCDNRRGEQRRPGRPPEYCDRPGAHRA